MRYRCWSCVGRVLVSAAVSFKQPKVSSLCPNSALAGAIAALAGLLGKLGADGDSSALQYLETQCQASGLSEGCLLVTSMARTLSLMLMLVANAVMLSCFVKGLHETDSLTATVTSAAVNFMLSAASGYFFFQEHLPMRWFLGATVILIGMVFLLHGDAAKEITQADHKKEN